MLEALNHMFNFSLLVDDSVASSLESKIHVCSELLIANMEITDGSEGASIAWMSGAELEGVRSLLIHCHKKIVLLEASRPPSDYEYYRQLFAKAYMLHVENIKVNVTGKEPAEEAEKLTDALKALLPLAQSTGIRLVIENEASSIVSDDRKLTALYKSIKTANTGIVFNPLEYVRMKAHPFFHAFYNSKLKDEVRFLRIQDGLFQDGSAVLPGEGNAEVKEMASILLKRSYKGYFSFTPYLEEKSMAQYIRMMDAFKKMLMEL
jgi:sugar phosphate isomerase/epimerase